MKKVEDYKNGDVEFLNYFDKIAGKKSSFSLDEIQETIKCLLNSHIKNEELSKKEVKEMIKFVCGIWLEEHTFRMLEELRDECKITDLAWNIECRINDTTQRTFEVDVIAVRGCQTFVFTCTTDDSTRICKGKSFEGIYRAEQLGGEKAKTILVCMASENVIENIRIDMSQFDAKNNFSIIGIDVIKNEELFKKYLKYTLLN